MHKLQTHIGFTNLWSNMPRICVISSQRVKKGTRTPCMSGEKCIVEKLVALYVSRKFYGLKKIPWSIIISCKARKLPSTFKITRLHFYIFVHITFLVSYRKFCIYFHEISLLYPYNVSTIVNCSKSAFSYPIQIDIVTKINNFH